MAKITQEALHEIFGELKKLLRPYEKGSLRARAGIEGKYDLWSEQPGLIIAGREKDELSCCSLRVQRSCAGFYYMPVYCHPAMAGQLPPDLLRTLKGKACFHLPSTVPSLPEPIKDALEKGYGFCVKNG